MIRNVIFDMGNVLLRFDRELFLDRVGAVGEDREALRREIFCSDDWIGMDRGDHDEPQAAEKMCARLPEHLHSAVHSLVSEWDEPMLPVAGMAELVEELKGNGYVIYLLSNASIRQHEYWPRIPGWQFFDGKIISADEKVMKPHPDYYLRALERFKLIPGECVFIDDVPANIEGAMYCGIPGIVFHGDAKLLRRQLREKGVTITE